MRILMNLDGVEEIVTASVARLNGSDMIISCRTVSIPLDYRDYEDAVADGIHEQNAGEYGNTPLDGACLRGPRVMAIAFGDDATARSMLRELLSGGYLDASGYYAYFMEEASGTACKAIIRKAG